MIGVQNAEKWMENGKRSIKIKVIKVQTIGKGKLNK